MNKKQKPPVAGDFGVRLTSRDFEVPPNLERSSKQQVADLQVVVADLYECYKELDERLKLIEKNK